MDRKLTEAEHAVWNAFLAGTPLDLRGPDPTQSDVSPDLWNPEQRVGADVICALVRGAATGADGDSPALRLSGALITGAIDLGDAIVRFPVELDRCYLERSASFANARTRSVAMTYCKLPRILGRGWFVDGRLEFRGTHAVQIDVGDAHVKGTLALGGAQLRGLDEVGDDIPEPYQVRQGLGFDGGSMEVDADVQFGSDTRDGKVRPFVCEGGMSLVGAIVRRSIWAGGTRLVGRRLEDDTTSFALDASYLQVGQSFSARAFVSDGQTLDFHADGAIFLRGVSIGATFDLAGASLESTDVAIDMTNGTVGGDILFDTTLFDTTLFDTTLFDTEAAAETVARFRSRGSLVLADAHISGSLYFTGAELGEDTTKNALIAERLSVDGVVRFWPLTSDGVASTARCEVRGGLQLYGCTLGALEIDGASLRTTGLPGGGVLPALNLSDTTVRQSVSGSVYAGARLDVSGGVLLAGVHIGGSLNLAGAALANMDGLLCLDAQRLEVMRDVHCTAFVAGTGASWEFEASGTVSLAVSTIHGTLYLAGSRFVSSKRTPGGEQAGSEVALDCGDLTMGALDAGSDPDLPLKIDGAFNLGGAKVSRDVNLGQATIDGAGLVDHVALDATLVEVGGDFALNSTGNADLRAKVDGSLSLFGATVQGAVRFENATISQGSFLPIAIVADNLSVGRDFLFGAGSLEGPLVLAGATIHKNLVLANAVLANDTPSNSEPDDDALLRDDEDLDRSDDDLLLHGEPLAADLVAFDGGRIDVKGDVHFTGLSATGLVSFDSATIAGRLSFNDVTLANPSGVSLLAASLATGGDLIARFISFGRVVLQDARIGGALNLDDAHLEVGPTGEQMTDLVAFDADGVEVKRSMTARRLRCRVTSESRITHSPGVFRLRNATVNADLVLDDARFSVATDTDGGGLSPITTGCAFAADHTVVTGELSCEGAIFVGQFSLVGASIREGVRLSGSRITSVTRPALFADDLTVGRDLIGTFEQRADARHTSPFSVYGGFSLVRATINGDVRLVGVATHGGKGEELPGLDARNLTVGGELSYRFLQGEPDRYDGWVCFDGSSIRNLSLSGHCTASDAPPLRVGANDVTSARVSLSFVGPHHRVDIGGAHVGELRYQVNEEDPAPKRDRAAGGRRPGKSERAAATVDASALVAQHIQLDCDALPAGYVDLSGGKLGELTVEWRKQHPSRTQPRLRLDGLEYDRLETRPSKSASVPGSRRSDEVARRIRWLDQKAWPVTAQPFEQLASFYRGQGDDRAARKVLLWKHRLQRRRSWSSPKLWPVQGFRLLQDALTGYGYAPGRALALLALAYVAAVAYFQAHPPEVVASGPPPTYRAWFFVLDSLVPTSPFGQDALWRASGLGFAVWFSLKVLGLLLVLSVLPAVARALSRN